MEKWAAENGVPSDQFIDLGMKPNEEMPNYLRDMDLAVFPNRCEGGTNFCNGDDGMWSSLCALRKHGPSGFNR